MTLREEVERRMRQASIGGPMPWLAVSLATDVAVALVEEERVKWGHAHGCTCEVGPDPRCAPRSVK